MANVLLIYPQPEENKNPRFSFSLNLLYLSSILKQHDHIVVDYMDLSLCNYSMNDIYKKLKLCDYVIIEMDSFSLKRSSNVGNAEVLIKEIKKIKPSMQIIAFGYDLTLFPRVVPYSDYSLPSYNYETKILNILNKREVSLDYSKEFDKLPFPDRNLLSDYIQHGGTLTHRPNLKKSTLIQTSRGCLNTCTFCQRKGWQNKYLTHSLEYVISEFQYLKDNEYINIWIADDNFTFNLKRAKTILKELIKKNISQNMKIACSSWTNIDKEFLDLAKKANISIISFGIESANNEILRFYKKEIDLEKVSRLISYANNIGLFTIGNFIIGAPMETEATISETFNYAINTPFDQVNIKILDYMRGSIIFNSLPEKIKKNKSHVFACKEVGLNNFYLLELKEKIYTFKDKFRKTRINQLKEKILKFGKPYEVYEKNHITRRST